MQNGKERPPRRADADGEAQDHIGWATRRARIWESLLNRAILDWGSSCLAGCATCSFESLPLSVGLSKEAGPRLPHSLVVTEGEGRKGKNYPIHMGPGQRPLASRF